MHHSSSPLLHTLSTLRHLHTLLHYRGSRRRQWLGLGCLGSDASTTSGSPPLSEQLLHVCGQALYPHLDLASRRCLRLVSKAARDAIDASVARLQLPEQRFKHSGKLIPIPQQVLRACARRWRSARHLAVNDFLDLHILPARLEGLEVRSCLAQPTPDSLAPLRAAAGSLQCLRVRCNALNAHGVCALASALRQLPQLTKLQLSGSQLGEEAAHALAPALLFLTRLTSLEVSNTHMAHRWQGAGAQALAPSLSCLLRLEHLHLAVGLGREGVEALAPVLAGLPALRHVDLSSNALEDGPLQCPASGSGSGGTTTALIPAATTAAAGSLGIGCVVLPLRPLQVALCCLGSSLSSLPCLQSLNLSFNRLGPSVSALAVALCDSHAPHLRTLGLAGSGLRGQGAAVAKLLCPLTALTGLDLSFNDFSADDARQLAPALAALPRLHSIDLGSNDLGDAGAAALAPALRRMDGLASLSLAAISVTGAGAAHVASALDCLPQLQALNVRSLVACQPGAGGQSHSGQLHAMRFLLPLAQMTGLLELDVGGSALGLVGATNLAKVRVHRECWEGRQKRRRVGRECRRTAGRCVGNGRVYFFRGMGLTPLMPVVLVLVSHGCQSTASLWYVCGICRGWATVDHSMLARRQLARRQGSHSLQHTASYRPCPHAICPFCRCPASRRCSRSCRSCATCTRAAPASAMTAWRC